MHAGRAIVRVRIPGYVYVLKKKDFLKEFITSLLGTVPADNASIITSIMTHVGKTGTALA